MAERRYRVFVYGTLLTGEDNHCVAAPYVRAVCPGKVNGRLYSVGPYPALVLGEEGEVEGEWLTVTEEGLKAMDELEDYAEGRDDNEYERIWVHDAHQPIEGYVYVYLPEKATGLPIISSGSWRRREEKT
ncbi:gamma-glutamylcyclotransferase [Geobacillus thermocatenulatus]|uniref:Gamma-glutamylcyclotransferase n=1 Tax=Geobacillus thermocatenulatus TaxID=33938 RepID=A0A226Q0Y1_9BACL|nr:MULTISPECIES: gamma-glutamylcyclotransferase family protein [Geobacillus]ASS99552.1 gamma-glutamylcyclotransferase [Geobacillus thermocatenulatus]KLR72999.1 gamma-glutamyl cyclotransferase [Geobacillus sp. T6]OXB85953.1 gamma-glutamylcyclotransferase [Geobacillus thermocatenulatus]